MIADNSSQLPIPHGAFCAKSNLNDNFDLLFPSLDIDTMTSTCSVSLAPEMEPLCPAQNFSLYNLEQNIQYDDSLLDDSDEDFEPCCYSDSDDESDNVQDVFDFVEPFWFGTEEPEQVQYILESYTSVIISPKEFSRSNQPFIGRVKRVNISSSEHVFQTFDCVTINNCQRMPNHKLIIPVIREEYCCTTWDSDGLPTHIRKLDSDETSELLLILKNDSPVPSFLHIQPDWHCLGEVSETEFHYSCSASDMESTYHGLPSRGAFASFVSTSIPEYIRVQLKEGLSGE